MNLVITGGTGSLGKAVLSQQSILSAYGISKIRVISRDEQKQVSITRSYTGKIPLDCYLGDVSDKERMMFALKDADYVIHAAAQKHIDKFELDIKTGYKTNIMGTQNVADGFLQSKNAKHAIFVSTDKAALPITSYGVSKLAAEHIWLWNNTYQKEIGFGVARYGNCWGSRGSVLELWTRQAIDKKPLTITDPNCTRFFMTLDRAAIFILHNLFEKNVGTLIPKMKSTEMVILAETIWEHFNAGEKFSSEIVGIRGIEKIHEILGEGHDSSETAPRFTKSELKEMYKVWLSESIF